MVLAFPLPLASNPAYSCLDLVALAVQAAGAPADVPLCGHHVPGGVRPAAYREVRMLLPLLLLLLLLLVVVVVVVLFWSV